MQEAMINVTREWTESFPQIAEYIPTSISSLIENTMNTLKNRL